MATTRPILANHSTNITNLKKNPSAIVKDANGEVVVVLSRDEPVFYLVPAAKYERIVASIDYIETMIGKADCVIEKVGNLIKGE